MASSDVTLPLLEKIGRESVKVNYDTANVEFYSGDKAVDDLPKIDELARPRPPQGHGGRQGDWDFGAIGSGVVDFAGCSRSSSRPATTGPYSVEIEFQGEPWPPLEEVTASMRSSREHLSGLGLS